MNFFLDTEFIDDGKTIDLISIGIAAQDGRTYYAISNEFDRSKADNWLVINVINRLSPPDNPEWKTRKQIRNDIIEFVGQGNPRFWGYYASYDWVVFCQLFGRLVDSPVRFPIYIMDLKQWAEMLGNPDLPKQIEDEHNALADALWNKSVYEFLRTYKDQTV